MMRIDCEICGATYAIDDALLQSGGVRARCPKCGTQQVVHAPTAAPEGDPAAYASPALQVLPPSDAPPVALSAGVPPTMQGAPPLSISANPFTGHSSAGSSHVAPLDADTSRNLNPFLSSAGSQAAGLHSSVFGPSNPRVPNPFTGATPASVSGIAAGANPFFEPSGSLTRAATASGVAATLAGSSVVSASAPGGPPATATPLPRARAPAETQAGAADGPRPVTMAQMPAARAPGNPDAALTDPALRAPSLTRLDADGGGGDGASRSESFAEPREPSGHFSLPSTEAAGTASEATDIGPLELGAQPENSNDLWSGHEERWEIRSSMASRADLTRAQVETMVRRGALGPFDEAGIMGQALVPIAHHPTLASLLPTQRGAASPPARGPAASPSLPAGRRPRLLVGAAALTLAGVGAVSWWATHPDALPVPLPAPLAQWGDVLRNALGASGSPSSSAPAAEVVASPFTEVRDIWAAQLPATQGSVHELIAQARKQMLLDTPEGQRAADELFRSAILLDAGHVDAIAGYIENFAASTEARIDAAALALAQRALAWAKAGAPEHPGVLVAESALHLSQGDLPSARPAIARRMTVATPDPESELLLARIMLDIDPDESLRIVDRVRRGAPSMAAALTVAAATHRRLGDYKRARDFLEERISTAPDHGAALKELARLELDVRDGKAALQWLEKVLEAEDRDIEAHLMRAKITYQLLNDWQKAEEQLRFVIDHLRTEAGALLRDAYVHYATVLTESGQLDLALKMADQGIALAPAHPPLRVARARALAAQGTTAEAAREFESAMALLEERDELRALSWVRTRLGELQARSGQEAEAERSLLRAVSEAPGEARPSLALLALYMRRGEPARANLFQRKLLDLDPMFPADRFELSDYYEKSPPLPDYAADIRDATVSDEERSLQRSAEGMMRFYGGQPRAARKLFDAALKLDALNHPALLFLSVLDLNAKKADAARKRLRQAERQVAGQHTITQLYLARAEADAGALADAQSRLETLVEQEPTLSAARYRLGEVLDRRGNAAAAQQVFRELLRSQPDYVPVKRRLALGEPRTR